MIAVDNSGGRNAGPNLCREQLHRSTSGPSNRAVERLAATSRSARAQRDRGRSGQWRPLCQRHNAARSHLSLHLGTGPSNDPTSTSANTRKASALRAGDRCRIQHLHLHRPECDEVHQDRRTPLHPPRRNTESAVDQVHGNSSDADLRHGAQYNSQGATLPGFPLRPPNSDRRRRGQRPDLPRLLATASRIHNPGSPLTSPTPRRTALTSRRRASTLNGTIDPDGVDTDTTAISNTGDDLLRHHRLPATEGQVQSGGNDIAVSADVTGLRQGGTYHYRITPATPTGS